MKKHRLISAVLVYAVYFLYPGRKKAANAELLKWGSEKLYRSAAWLVGILSWIAPVVLWGVMNRR